MDEVLKRVREGGARNLRRRTTIVSSQGGEQKKEIEREDKEIKESKERKEREKGRRKGKRITACASKTASNSVSWSEAALTAPVQGQQNNRKQDGQKKEGKWWKRQGRQERGKRRSG